MQWTVVGLGNPGVEYESTRHNVGRDFVRAIAKKEGVEKWKSDLKAHAQSAKVDLFGKKATLVLPDTYMNHSGKALRSSIASPKSAEGLVVIHDELDLPLGTVKLSFGSGPGGHKGVDSIQKTIKTKDFVRIRIGISPTTAAGRLKKPQGEKVVDFVLAKFKPAEAEKLKKVQKTVAHALELLFLEGRAHATMVIHSAK